MIVICNKSCVGTEHNSSETKWNARTSNTFYSDVSKRSTRPPHHDTSELLSLPTAKRKTIDVIRTTGDRTSPTKTFPKRGKFSHI